MPMSHAENTYDFEIAEDDPHYDDMVLYGATIIQEQEKYKPLIK